MSDLSNDMSGSAGEPQYLFDADGGVFWKEMPGSGEWIKLKEGALRRELMKRGKRHKIVNGSETISEVDAEIRVIEQEKRITMAIEVAGYRAGVQMMGPDRVLVPRAAPLVQEKEGEFLLTQAFYEGLFRGWEEHFVGEGEQTETQEIDQRDRVFAWEQHWVESLFSGRPTKGLALHIAGQPNCGKTRYSEHCRDISGGRAGRPYRYMIGRENFNKSGIGASLQLVDDDQADTSREARKEFGAQIKKMTANEEVEARSMHRDGFNLKPCWRLLVLTNMQEQALQVMPQITLDLQDKVFMAKGYTRLPLPSPGDVEGWAKYRARYPALSAWWDYAVTNGILKEADLEHCWPMPMPTGSPRLQAAFWDRMQGELPAFVFWLRHRYVAPSHVAGGRFGVRHWQHPQILGALQAFASHVRFFQLIERSEVVWKVQVPDDSNPEAGSAMKWVDQDEWTGSSSQLEVLLKSDASKLSRHEKEKEVPAASYIGQRLTEAMESWGDGVVRDLPRTRKDGRRWWLKRTPHLLA